MNVGLLIETSERNKQVKREQGIEFVAGLFSEVSTVLSSGDTDKKTRSLSSRSSLSQQQ